MNNVAVATPGAALKTEKMPGHRVLARLGKRVLRPGGMELTRRMLKALRIGHEDDVVEFAPGMGITAQLTIKLMIAPSYDADFQSAPVRPSPLKYLAKIFQARLAKSSG